MFHVFNRSITHPINNRNATAFRCVCDKIKKIDMKIIDIKGCKTCKQVLIFKERNDNGEDYAKIVAWHDTENGQLYQEETFDSGGNHNEVVIDRFIADFSEFSANAFANDFTP